MVDATAAPRLRFRPMNWLLDLFSGNELRVNAVITCGIAALATLIGCTVYVLIQAPTAFNPITYATGAGTLIGAIGAGKGVHDRLQPPGGQ